MEDSSATDESHAPSEPSNTSAPEFKDRDKMSPADLERIVEEFLRSDATEQHLELPAYLRRHLRNFRPRRADGLRYVAMGAPPTLQLTLAKHDIPPTPWKNLGKKTRECFIKHTRMKIVPNIDDATMAMLDPYIGLTEWMRLMNEAIAELGGEIEFLNTHFDLERKSIARFHSHPKFEELKQMPMPEEAKLRYKPNTKNFWSAEVDGQWFLGIDLKAANYQAVR